MGAKLAKLTIVLGCLGATAFNLVQSVDVRAPASGPVTTISFEAEAASEILPPFLLASTADDYTGEYVSLVPNDIDRALQYEVTVAEPGEYTLWARTKWKNSCRNIILVSVNDSQFSTLGNDSAYGEWHWVKGPSYRLRRGTNTLSVRDTGTLVALPHPILVDRFMLTNADVPVLPSGELVDSQALTFADNFSRGWRDRWTSISGRWEPTDLNGLAYLQQESDARALLIADAPTYDDYGVEVAIRGADAAPKGLVFDYAGPDDYSLTRIVQGEDHRLLEVARVRAGREELLARIEVGNQRQGWETLRLETLEDEIQVFLNDREPIRVAGRGGPERGVGLFSHETSGAAFDDFRVESIASFSESRFPGRGTTPFEVVNLDFDHSRDRAGWKVLHGKWSQRRGSLQSRGSAVASIIRKHGLNGNFKVVIDAKWSRREPFTLHLVSSPVSYAFRLESDGNGQRTRTDLLRNGEVVETRESEITDSNGVITLTRSDAGFALMMGNTTLLETHAIPDGGSFRVGIKASRVEISSFRVSQVPYFRYNPWEAPVGWEPVDGELEVGHQFASVRSYGDTAYLWNTHNFSCLDVTYGAALFIRGDANPDAYLDLILCNKGTESVNGLSLRFQLVDRPQILGSRERRVLISLMHNDIVLDQRRIPLETHMSGFVGAPVSVGITRDEIQVSLWWMELFRVPNPVQTESGVAGVRFASAEQGASKMLGLGYFQVFQ